MLSIHLQSAQPKGPQLKEVLGYTLSDLLEPSNKNSADHPLYFQLQGKQWLSYSNRDLKRLVSHTAAGLIQLGLDNGDRVALLLKSDFTFLAVDLACAKAGLITVPLDLSQTIENILYSLNHSEAQVLFIASQHLLNQLTPYLEQCPGLQWVVLTEKSLPPQKNKKRPSLLSRFRKATPPPNIGLDLSDKPSEDESNLWEKTWGKLSWERLRQDGIQLSQNKPERLKNKADSVQPHSLATIIYIPDESGQLLGVTLSHENLTSTALASFAEMDGVQKGDRLSVVTFLPLTHIFARVMLYGHLFYSHRIYFSTPRRIMKHLIEIRPQILSTVPLLMHKVYRRLERYGREDESIPQLNWRTKLLQSISFKPWLQRYHQWAFSVANQPTTNWWKWNQTQTLLAKPVFKRWRKLFGGRIQYCLTGGAALNTEVAQFFLNIGFPIYQGYGLTQTSSVVTFNRPQNNQPGSVGEIRLGTNIKIAQDGEILVHGTGIMQRYWKATSATNKTLKNSWLHTGDLGYLDSLGRLFLTGRKKHQFKLTTGKYVTPIPLEQNLELSPLVQKALVVGEEQKYCAALIFIQESNLQLRAIKMGLVHYPVEALIDNPCIQALYQSIIDEANCHFPYWTTIKKIKLLSPIDYPSIFFQTSEVDQRNLLLERLKPLIEELYNDSSRQESSHNQAEGCQGIPLVSCPMSAKSLKTSY